MQIMEFIRSTCRQTKLLSNLIASASNVNHFNNKRAGSILKVKASENGFIQYVNPLLGISLQYPSNWSKTEQLNKSEVTFVTPKEHPWDPYQANLRISVQSFDNLQSSLLDELVKERVVEYKENLSRYPLTVDSITAFGFNRHTNQTVVYYYGDPYEKKVRETFFISGNRLYSIAYTALSYGYAHFLPIVEKTLDSLKVVESSKPHPNNTNEHMSLTNPINLSNSSDELRDNENPHITISENGTVYVVWENPVKAQILFSKSTDGGASFSSPIILNDRNGCCFAAKDPEIAASGSHSIYVIWNENHNFVMFTRSTDGGASFSEKTIWGSNGSPAINKARLDIFNNNVYLVLFSTDSTPYPISFVMSSDGGAEL